jgi:hypothetical protein
MRTRKIIWVERGIATDKVKPVNVHMLAFKGLWRSRYPFFLTSLTLVNAMPSARSLV